MVAHPLSARPLRLAPLRLPLASRPRRLARRASSWLLAAAAIAFAAYVLIGALSSAAWWTFNSGPLTGDPEIVLTEPSPSGAVRVYGDTPELAPGESAAKAVDTLDAEGGFARSTLVVALPTGSGWVDPKEIDALERHAGGDLATISMRYSRAPSGAVYVLRPEVAEDSAHALLSAVAERLRTMEPGERPRLIVHGQSLGAQAGEAALADRALLPFVSAVLWQGRPGEEFSRASNAAPLGDCAVSAVNGDDPVTKLSWHLLADPAEAVGVLSRLPGSESKTPGTAHSYVPLLPPEHCTPEGPADGRDAPGGAAIAASTAGNRVR